MEDIIKIAKNAITLEQYDDLVMKNNCDNYNLKEDDSYWYLLPNGLNVVDGEIVEDYSAKQTSINAQIEELKKQLTNTDYKIIKCYECSLIGEELPYNVVELHKERQKIRNMINSIENE